MQYVLFKSSNRAYLEEMANRTQDMPEIYDCVNALQDTAFKINIKILQVADTIFNNGGVVGKMPHMDKIPLPPKPFDIATNKIFDEKIENTNGGITWSLDDKSFFY